MASERRLTAADILADARPDVLEGLEAIHANVARVHALDCDFHAFTPPEDQADRDRIAKARGACRAVLIAKTPIDIALDRKGR